MPLFSWKSVAKVAKSWGSEEGKGGKVQGWMLKSVFLHEKALAGRTDGSIFWAE